MAKSAGLLVLAWFLMEVDLWTNSVGALWSNGFVIGQFQLRSKGVCWDCDWDATWDWSLFGFHD